MLYQANEMEDLQDILKNLSFAFNKPPQANKINFIIGEFASLNFTVDMVKKGIEFLRNDLDFEPTFKQLKKAISSFLPMAQLEGCEKCCYSGFITMTKHIYDYAFCCDCEKGNGYVFENKIYNRRSLEDGLKSGYTVTVL